MDLKLGDCTNPQTYNGEFIDLTITSPPYNLGIDYDNHNDVTSHEAYLKFTKTWLTNVYTWSKPNARCCVNVPFDVAWKEPLYLSGDFTKVALECGWKYRMMIAWDKKNISSRTAWGSWMSPSAPKINIPLEVILVFYKGEWKKEDLQNQGTDLDKEDFIAWTNGLWSISPESATRIGHPVPFPLEIPHRLVRLFSWVGDTVFDPFAGSGTTLIASHNNKRKAIGLEISPKYYEIAKRRMSLECFTLF